MKRSNKGIGRYLGILAIVALPSLGQSFRVITYSAGGKIQQIAVGDFNGDGKPDLATATPAVLGYRERLRAICQRALYGSRERRRVPSIWSSLKSATAQLVTLQLNKTVRDTASRRFRRCGQEPPQTDMVPDQAGEVNDRTRSNLPSSLKSPAAAGRGCGRPPITGSAQHYGRQPASANLSQFCRPERHDTPDRSPGGSTKIAQASVLTRRVLTFLALAVLIILSPGTRMLGHSGTESGKVDSFQQAQTSGLGMPPMTMAMPMVAPLFLENQEFSSTLYMVNELNIPASAEVMLFGLDGNMIGMDMISFPQIASSRLTFANFSISSSPLRPWVFAIGA